MTEQEWLACAEPGAMLEALQGRGADPPPSDRKLRLALCACARRVWGSLGPEGRAAVATAERYADGREAAEALSLRTRAAAVEAGSAGRYTDHNPACWAACWVAQEQLSYPDQVLRSAATAAGFAAVPYERCLESPDSPAWLGPYNAERAAQAAVLREVFGDPSRPARCLCGPPAARACPQAGTRPGGGDPTDGWRCPAARRILAWEGGTVPKLAAAIYEERAFDHLPILGDALEESGCADAVVLVHCRGGGPHVRGCWVLDLLLGKA